MYNQSQGKQPQSVSPLRSHILRTPLPKAPREQFIIKNAKKVKEKASIDKENQRLFMRLLNIMSSNQYMYSLSKKESPRPKSSSFFQRNRWLAQVDQDNCRIATKLCATKPLIGTLQQWNQDYSQTKIIKHRLRQPVVQIGLGPMKRQPNRVIQVKHKFNLFNNMRNQSQKPTLRPSHN